MKHRSRTGFTLMELLVTITVVTVLSSLILPTIVSVARENSRKQTCANNMRSLGLALLEYEQTYKRLVCYDCTWGYGGYSGIPYWDIAPGYDGAGRWSGFIALLPFMNEAPLNKAFQEGTSGSLSGKKKSWGPFGSIAGAGLVATFGAPADSLRYPWSTQYPLNRRQVSVFRCPADPGRMQSGKMMGVARTNYAFCMGDGILGIDGGDPNIEQTRGGFQRNLYKRFSGITDGSANVIAFGEIATPEVALFAKENQGVTETDAKVQGRAIYELASLEHLKGIDVKACRAFVKDGHYAGTKRNWGNIGFRNFDALATYTGFNTINPPNGGSCTPTNNTWGEGEGIYTASSYHLCGAHVVMFNGDLKFINNGISTIDNRVGMTDNDYYAPGRQVIDGELHENANWKTESPFGVWGAMGSVSGNDYACFRPTDSLLNSVRSMAYIPK